MTSQFLDLLVSSPYFFPISFVFLNFKANFRRHDRHPKVCLRGAVSIARRLLDPLAELVKIDARSIGVGLYQHDVDQKRLAEDRDLTVVFWKMMIMIMVRHGYSYYNISNMFR